MNLHNYDLYYTAVKNRDDKEVVNDEYENNENDYNNFNVFVTPNHYIGRNSNNERLR